MHNGRGIVIAAILGVGLVNALALTPPERNKIHLALDAVKLGLQQNMDLRYEAAQARTEASTANSLAGSAWASAFTVGLKAKNALEEAKRCKNENDEMRPIVEQWKKLQGPWWFRGLNGLIYFAGKSLLSLVIILVGAFVLFLIIKVLITVFTGGTFSAGLGVAGGILGKLGRWFMSLFRRIPALISRLNIGKPKPKDP